MHNTKTYAVVNLTDIDLVDFSQVGESSVFTIRKSVDETVVIEKKKSNIKKDIKLNRAEAVRQHRRDSRKISVTKFLIIAAIIIIITAVIYLVLKDNSTAEIVEETLPPIERIDNATYIERTYDIPVTYPYLKPEADMKLIGLSLIDSRDVNPEKIIDDKKPPKKVVAEEKPIVSYPVNKPAGTPLMKAYNIYKYEDIYVVQVASLRKKTSAENEATKYIAQGYNNAAIADALGLSERTIETYISRIYQALHITGEQDIHARVRATLIYLQNSQA